MNQAPDARPVLAHRLFHGKMVSASDYDRTGPVQRGVDYELTSMSKNCPRALRSFATAISLAPGAQRIEDVFARRAPGVDAVFFRTVWPQGDDPYLLASRIDLREEGGVGRGGRLFTQCHTLAVKLSDWRPFLASDMLVELYRAQCDGERRWTFNQQVPDSEAEPDEKRFFREPLYITERSFTAHIMDGLGHYLQNSVGDPPTWSGATEKQRASRRNTIRLGLALLKKEASEIMGRAAGALEIGSDQLEPAPNFEKHATFIAAVDIRRYLTRDPVEIAAPACGAVRHSATVETDGTYPLIALVSDMQQAGITQHIKVESQPKEAVAALGDSDAQKLLTLMGSKTPDLTDRSILLDLFAPINTQGVHKRKKYGKTDFGGAPHETLFITKYVIEKWRLRDESREFLEYIRFIIRDTRENEDVESVFGFITAFFETENQRERDSREEFKPEVMEFVLDVANNLTGDDFSKLHQNVLMALIAMRDWEGVADKFKEHRNLLMLAQVKNRDQPKLEPEDLVKVLKLPPAVQESQPWRNAWDCKARLELIDIVHGTVLKSPGDYEKEIILLGSRWRNIGIITNFQTDSSNNNNPMYVAINLFIYFMEKFEHPDLERTRFVFDSIYPPSDIENIRIICNLNVNNLIKYIEEIKLSLPNTYLFFIILFDLYLYQFGNIPLFIKKEIQIQKNFPKKIKGDSFKYKISKYINKDNPSITISQLSLMENGDANADLAAAMKELDELSKSEKGFAIARKIQGDIFFAIADTYKPKMGPDVWDICLKFLRTSEFLNNIADLVDHGALLKNDNSTPTSKYAQGILAEIYELHHHKPKSIQKKSDTDPDVSLRYFFGSPYEIENTPIFLNIITYLIICRIYDDPKLEEIGPRTLPQEIKSIRDHVKVNIKEAAERGLIKRSDYGPWWQTLGRSWLEIDKFVESANAQKTRGKSQQNR